MNNYVLIVISSVYIFVLLVSMHYCKKYIYLYIYKNKSALISELCRGGGWNGVRFFQGWQDNQPFLLNLFPPVARTQIEGGRGPLSTPLTDGFL